MFLVSILNFVFNFLIRHKLLQCSSLMRVSIKSILRVKEWTKNVSKTRFPSLEKRFDCNTKSNRNKVNKILAKINTNDNASSQKFKDDYTENTDFPQKNLSVFTFSSSKLNIKSRYKIIKKVY